MVTLSFNPALAWPYLLDITQHMILFHGVHVDRVICKRIAISCFFLNHGLLPRRGRSGQRLDFNCKTPCKHVEDGRSLVPMTANEKCVEDGRSLVTMTANEKCVEDGRSLVTMRANEKCVEDELP